MPKTNLQFLLALTTPHLKCIASVRERNTYSDALPKEPEPYGAHPLHGNCRVWARKFCS